MLGEWIKQQIQEQERREERERLDRQYRHLFTMPANTLQPSTQSFSKMFALSSSMVNGTAAGRYITPR